jgi:hypothetical protein
LDTCFTLSVTTQSPLSCFGLCLLSCMPSQIKVHHWFFVCCQILECYLGQVRQKSLPWAVSPTLKVRTLYIWFSLLYYCPGRNWELGISFQMYGGIREESMVKCYVFSYWLCQINVSRRRRGYGVSYFVILLNYLKSFSQV